MENFQAVAITGNAGGPRLQAACLEDVENHSYLKITMMLFYAGGTGVGKQGCLPLQSFEPHAFDFGSPGREHGFVEREDAFSCDIGRRAYVGGESVEDLLTIRFLNS